MERLRRDEALFQFHANADRAARSILGKLHGLALKYQTARCVSNAPRALHPQWSVKRREEARRDALIEIPERRRARQFKWYLKRVELKSSASDALRIRTTYLSAVTSKNLQTIKFHSR